MPRTKNETVPSQFRLGKETLDDLDAIARLLGQGESRTAAVRWAARWARKRLEYEDVRADKKKSKKSAE